MSIKELEVKHKITYFVKFETHERSIEWKEFEGLVYDEVVDLDILIRKFMEKLCSNERVLWGLEIISMDKFRKATLCKIKFDGEIIELGADQPDG